MKHPLNVLFFLLLLMPLVALHADVRLAFSDPARIPRPPAYAIGVPSRDPYLDALPGFRQPPPGYGEVAFYWWLGDPLTKERLGWHIEQLDQVKGVMGLQINYAHAYRNGGLTVGLSYPSKPALFSASWWELVGWFKDEAKRHGMAISLSDYTLGIGQGCSVDDLLRQNPDLNGSLLQQETRDIGAGTVEWLLPPGTLMVGAQSSANGAWIDLRNLIENGVLRWQAPVPYRLMAVFAQQVIPSLDPMNPKSGPLYAKKFFGQFEEHFPGEGGRGLNFFFSDELSFRVEGNLWTTRFAEEFRRRKGYDLLPQLPALFADAGPRTPKVRLDYSDVKVALSEEGFFKPVFDWHQERGMIYGCDHGGRGRNVTEFGDYFRTQRWNQGPGCDQPGLSHDIIKNKVASSIAHLYLRPRVWLEGFHSSGWGTNSEGLTDATFANFAQGQNMLTLHGLYYSTHGSFWEWAPPDNHFRMPYWAHMREYFAMVQRLSYLMSQGHHRCDVAILYPVAPMEAGLAGKAAVDAAFNTGRQLYSHGIDFDFMDFESLDRSSVSDRQLQVSGESYRVLVLPAMRAARWSTLQKAQEFQRAGGTVIVLGAAPEASDRAGRNDPELNALVAQLTTWVETPEEVADAVDKATPRDFAVLSAMKSPPNLMHRRIGQREVFMVHNVPANTECWFRARGTVELWDPWTGATRPLPVLAQTSEGTRLRLPLTEKEGQLIVFSPGVATVADPPILLPETSTIALAGDWEFELQPTLDNRFGDYRWPPSQGKIGAEVRQYRYADEGQPNPGWEALDFDDSKWRVVTHSFGQKFWKLGPLPDGTELDAKLAGLQAVDPSVPVEIGGRKFTWQPYEFSWRWGCEGDAGPQGWHGLKASVSNDFIVLGERKRRQNTGDYDLVAEPGGGRYYLWTAAYATQNTQAVIHLGGNLPGAVYINGARLDHAARSVRLRSGSNPLLLRYDQIGRGHFVLEQLPATADTAAPQGALAMRWSGHPGVVTFDVRPQISSPAGWYRFTAPPGLHAMTLSVPFQIRAWADGQKLKGTKTTDGVCFVLPQSADRPSKVALRIEQDRGDYGGAALPEPIKLDCVTGRMPAGDWSKIGVMASYSGGAWYRRSLNLTAEQAQATVTLDLGKVVSTAEVRVNGQAAGVRVSPPWRFNISRHIKPGDNRIEVLVYNTLANHYLTIPTRYRGDLTSGLLGPVTLEVVETNVRPVSHIENYAPFPGEKSDFRGYDRYRFTVDSSNVMVVCPKQAAPGKPWLWRGAFWGDKSYPFTEMTVIADLKLVELGFHLVTAGPNVLLGHPSGNRHMDAVYNEMVNQHGLGEKPAMVGLSREALGTYRWAAANPDKVACIFMDAPVCDMQSWPGGKLVPGSGSKADGAPDQWKLLLKTYGFNSDAEALAYRGSPIDLLEPLAKARVPILHNCGGSDTAVPVEENSAVLKRRYEALGGKIDLIVNPGIGHHPCGLEDPTPIVEFIQRHAANHTPVRNTFVPDFKINPDNYTVLMAADGKNPDGLRAWINDHRRMQVKNWPLGGQTTWDIEVVEPGDYVINVLFNHRVKMPLRVSVMAGPAHCTGTSEYIARHEWRRFALPGSLRLARGKTTLALTIAPAGDTSAEKIELLSIELVRPEVKERLHRAALAMRTQTDTQWFRQAGFGLMCHLTSQSMPRNGAPKPYADAVRDFDVAKFTEQVAQTGAQFVCITTSHALMYFPAPLKSLDRILPGRTAHRDLVADIADALGKRGIRLMLYYHLGSNDDRPWQEACGFWKTNTTDFWNNWTAVIGEAGERYGDKLAGWWFDDGTANYYYRSTPWERLATAAKTGNPKRLICFNPWILPPATEFQDYHAGEGNSDPTVQGWLKPGDHGRVSGGAYEGLQASCALTMEGDWLHTKLDTEIRPPRQTAAQLADMLRRFAALENVPMLNCEIYQDGTLSPLTVEVLKSAHELQ
jgi:hypothetical protein